MITPQKIKNYKYTITDRSLDDKQVMHGKIEAVSPLAAALTLWKHNSLPGCYTIHLVSGNGKKRWDYKVCGDLY